MKKPDKFRSSLVSFLGLCVCVVLTGMVIPGTPGPKRIDKSPLTVFQESQSQKNEKKPLRKQPQVLVPQEQLPKAGFGNREGRLQLPNKKRY